MQENVHLCLSDLLDQDISSNEFFNTLSPNVQRRLMDKDIRTFEELQKCANAYKKTESDHRAVLLDRYNPAFSSGDCTGLIPIGSNLSEAEYKNYQQIYPFGDPPYENENG